MEDIERVATMKAWFPIDPRYILKAFTTEDAPGVSLEEFLRGSKFLASDAKAVQHVTHVATKLLVADYLK
eukprot:1687069-Karenia_brevis.AAC.1